MRGLYFLWRKFGLQGMAWFFFAAAVVIFVPVDLQFQQVNARKQLLKDWAHVGWTLRKCIFSAKDFALDACARFGGPAQTCFVESG